MSKSKANELLQELHSNLTANWTGKGTLLVVGSNKDVSGDNQ